MQPLPSAETKPAIEAPSYSHTSIPSNSQSPLKTAVDRRQSVSSLQAQTGVHDEKHVPVAESRNGSGVTIPGPTFTNNNNNGILSTPSGGAKSGAPGPSVINKQLLSKLNKSLKEKQKTTASREPQMKNPTLIQSVLSTSPLFSTGSNIAAGSANTSAADVNNSLGSISHDEYAKADTTEGDLLSVTSSVQNAGKEPGAMAKVAKGKNKKIAKQNSTRTDFFAAKLASAVDDVESSDSDETFVYETNAHEFGSEPDEVVPAAAGGTISPAAGRSTEHGSHAENINHAPASIQLVNDNISVAGSLRNAHIDISGSAAISPVGEPRREEERETGAYGPGVVTLRAESIHSLQSAKPHIRASLHAIPPTTTTATTTITNGRLHIQPGVPVQNDYHNFSDPYMDSSHLRYQRQPTRKGSSHSMLSDERKDHILRSPHSPYGASKLNANVASYGLSEHSQSLHRPYQEGLYAYGEEDASGDETSSHGDIHLVCTENNGGHGSGVPNGNKGSDGLAAGYKPRSNKPSTTSSKLRSTTSKLFDKKGAQPRRYSTIPDDIDIEDFDDELIYYDNNNTRFPYHNNNGSLNESSSLLHGHKLPHHRSLNLNFNNKRAAANSRNTRYVSLGYVTPGSYPNANNKKNDIFPFPYPDRHQQSFYGFDEYDEESQPQLPEIDTHAKHFQGRSPLSPSNNHYLLPRRVSQDQAGGEKLRIIKSVIYTLVGIICILAVGFILGFLLASTKDLSNVSILSINHATVSQDELIFNVVIEAINPGWLTVSLEELELDVFVKSGYLVDDYSSTSVETVLLGSVLNFESALYFEGSFFNRQATQQTGEVKLIGPGKNFTGSQLMDTSLTGTSLGNSSREPNDPQNSPDNSAKWAIISKHPFDLILRGVIKYNLPWTNNVKSVVVNKVGYIDPSQSF